MAFPLVDGAVGETTDVHAGMVVKRVRVATTGAGTLATSFENGDTVDGVVLATGDRILLKNQAAGADNGIYVVAASGAPTRSLDFDETAEVLPNTIVVVSEGTTNADSSWMLTTNATITLDTTALVFTAYAVAAGANILTTPAEYAGDQTGIGTSFTNATSFTVSPTIGANPVIIWGYIKVIKTAGAGDVQARVYDSTAAAQVGQIPYITLPLNAAGVIPFFVYHAPAAGARTYVVQLAASANTCTNAGGIMTVMEVV